MDNIPFTLTKPGSLRDRARRAFGTGMSRNEIAKAEGVTYAAIYRLTRDLPPTHRRGRIGTRLEDGRIRSDAMRAAYAAGATVKEIAAEFNVSYQAAWQVTRGYQRRRSVPTTEEQD